MSLKRKLTILAAIFCGLILVYAGISAFVQTRVDYYRDKTDLVEKIRYEIALQSMYMRQINMVEKGLEQTTPEEVNRILAASAENTELYVGMLSDAIAAQKNGKTDLAYNFAYFHQLWVLYKDALQGALTAALPARHIQFVHDNVIELSNRATDVLQSYERLYRSRMALSSWLFWIFLTTLAGTLVTGIVIIQRRLFKPLRTLTERIKLMSSGNLPLEHNMPFETEGEVGELSHFFNVLIERLRQASQTKDRFLATMSHEIRTPMNGVIGFLGNLRETQLNEQQQQYVTVIDSSARALLRVINEVLDFSKLTAGKMELDIVAFDLSKLLQDLISVTRQNAREKNLRVRLEMTDLPNWVIRGDPTRLRQVLDNLLNNAVKFTEKGEIVLAVQVAPETEDKSRITFSVSDTGIGIPPAEQEHLFEAFTQAKASVSRRFGGTGLGLSIAADLAALMGGELKVESTPAEGTRFYFEIQTSHARPEEQVTLSEHYEVILPRNILKKYWTLLVDDTSTNLFLMETICQSIGLPYMTAINGKEAVEKARQFKFDLIFMDIQMPVMDGYTAIREIRQLESAATTQIIALTASAMQEDVDRALGVGSTGFLAKPFERNQLLLCIAEHLGIPVEKEFRTAPETRESCEEAAVRQMYDYMREQYQISLGEIKLILAQSVADWRPQLDDILVFSKKGTWAEVRAIMHRFKGQLGAIGLPKFAETASFINEKIKDQDFDGLTMVLENYVNELGSIFRAVERNVTLDQHSSSVNKK